MNKLEIRRRLSQNLIRDRLLRNRRKSSRIFRAARHFLNVASSSRRDWFSFFLELDSSLQCWSFAFTRVSGSKMSAQVTTINHREAYRSMNRPNTATITPRTARKSRSRKRPTHSKSRSPRRKTRTTMTSWASCTAAIKPSQRPKEKSITREVQWTAWKIAGSEPSSSGAYLHYLMDNENFNWSSTHFRPLFVYKQQEIKRQKYGGQRPNRNNNKNTRRPPPRG